MLQLILLQSVHEISGMKFSKGLCCNLLISELSFVSSLIQVSVGVVSFFK